MLRSNAFTTGAVLAFSVAASASAQSMSTEIGEFEYLNSCASCHGVDGKGAGPLADLLSTTVPNLTELQSANGGVFPVSRVYETIDGSAEVAAHGVREMPVWGMRYMERAHESADLAPTAADAYPRMRILSLIEYLSTIQE